MKTKRKAKIKIDRDGWVRVAEHKPDKYDLVRIQNHSGDQQFAWWTGYCWDSGIKTIRGIPYRWKRLPRGYEF